MNDPRQENWLETLIGMIIGGTVILLLIVCLMALFRDSDEGSTNQPAKQSVVQADEAVHSPSATR
ncbi:MAG: hypothetical protein COU22_02035 [Candidatus Komeilibacteria bacterium CG10_big_fil_rev_8_21_14_0_10_41_13]|uniref:Uncharacterized protein n=1 Tax=Candidatus Komeilibacteria bacterium CG10_big_fil_rev_8_21_14_0_10_41_13 TaxID=1974476 RepID=A0A2M6WCJ6_9BACT|nr:MAG: hypothetical protein COU22_02035 [Candidatus Komeilibacteria bacterium CG10_big_fil_rev_8_21_14_0_10_41_13]